MAKLYVPSRVLTPLDRVRAELDEAEQLLSKVRGAGPQAVKVLHLFDQIARDLIELELENVDVRVERSRFEMIQGRLRRSKGSLHREISDTLKPRREQVAPPRSHWWWYVDEAIVRQRGRRLLRTGAVTSAAIALLMAGWLAYLRFLAPPPSVREALRHVDAGQDLVAEGNLNESNLNAALEHFLAAADLTPEDPEPWLWQGVLYGVLGKPDKGQDAFDVARPLCDTDFEFHLNRGRVYLEAGQLEQAAADTRRAMAEDPASGWPHYLRAGIRFQLGDHDRAVADLERAAGLAHEAGDTQLEALARTQQTQMLKLAPIPSSTP
ncbi:MAG: hypothetical protein PVI63_10180 [Anaerolineae bacterium]